MNAPVIVLLVAVCSPALSAAPHGGMYRGPGDNQPPSSKGSSPPPPSSSGPTTGGGTAGTDSGAAGPTTPGSSAARGRAVTGGAIGSGLPRGIMVGEDFSKWQYWWEYNKDAYLHLKASLRSNAPALGSDEFFMGTRGQGTGRLAVRPGTKDIDETILPALRRALETTDNRDIASACLVALAKIGRDTGGRELLPTLRGYLVSPDQEIRETAALAMGISQQAAAIAPLVDLATDTAAGQRLTGRARVDARTRAFAAYGLGLVVHANRVAGVRLRALQALRSILSDTAIVDRNVKVAAVNALSLLACRDDDPAALRIVADGAVRALRAFYEHDASVGRDVLRAHVPTAIARLVGRRDDALARELKELFSEELRSGVERSGLIVRSAALALGQLAFAAEGRPAEARYSELLRKYFEAGKDGQARYFCLMALGQIGGTANRAFLLRVLARGKRTLERPWAALALGCLVHRARVPGAVPDLTVSAALHEAFKAAKNPYARGAMAIALGLCGYDKAAPDLIAYLGSHAHQDEMSGYLCVGLALMRHDAALDPIIAVLDNSVRRPHRMRMAAVALGKLGDRRLSKRLLDMLDQKEPNLARMAAVAAALAQIGDRASIAPLCRLLADRDMPAISRAFAAVALGGIADKEPEPWNAKLASNMNYRAAVETLVQSGAGILEIL